MSVRIHVFGRYLSGQAVGAVVVVLAALVFHGSTLYFKFLLGYGIQQKAHTIGFEPKGYFELVAGHRLEIVGAVAVGSTIECTARLGYDFEVLLIGHIVGALEHHVLKEVGKTRLADFLAGRAYVVGYVHVYNRVGLVFVDDEGKSIRKDVLFVRNNDFLPFFADLLYEACLRRRQDT